MNIIKTEQKEGECYGVVYNPQEQSVTICYRNVDNVIVLIDEMTDEEKQAVEVYGARFLARAGHGNENTLVTNIHADIAAKLAELKEKIVSIE